MWADMIIVIIINATLYGLFSRITKFGEGEVEGCSSAHCSITILGLRRIFKRNRSSTVNSIIACRASGHSISVVTTNWPEPSKGSSLNWVTEKGPKKEKNAVELILTILSTGWQLIYTHMNVAPYIKCAWRRETGYLRFTIFRIYPTGPNKWKRVLYPFYSFFLKYTQQAQTIEKESFTFNILSIYPRRPKQRNRVVYFQHF